MEPWKQGATNIRAALRELLLNDTFTLLTQTNVAIPPAFSYDLT